MSNETTDTLGNQKKHNYALREDMTREEFIKEVTQGLTPPPSYFPLNARLNKEGYESFNSVLKKGTSPLDPEQFESVANAAGAVMLDTRDPQSFAQGFVPNSINIGIDGSFAPWVGSLLPDNLQPILIIADEGREEEVVTRLARVGYDNTIGYLKNGIESWKAAGKELNYIDSISVEELAKRVKKETDVNILDVRKESEYSSEHIIGAENIALDYINENMNKVDKNKTYYVHCGGGYRSMIFNSILKARGYDNLIDLKGGFKALKESGDFAISPYVCPKTAL